MLSYLSWRFNGLIKQMLLNFTDASFYIDMIITASEDETVLVLCGMCLLSMC